MLAARALLALAPLLGAAPPPAQEPASAAGLLDELDGERPLDNDTFVPTNETAEEHLLEGDRWLASRDEALPADLELAFEAWRSALVASVAGDVVACELDVRQDAGAPLWHDADGTAGRRSEGVQHAVLRRLEQLGSEARARWRARFAAVSDAELAEAGRHAEALAEVERRNPATPAAARAALLLADRALEEGRGAAAACWIERALLHARGTDLSAPGDGAPDASFEDDVIEPRRRVARALGAAPEQPSAHDWRTTQGFELVNIVLLEEPGVVGREGLPAPDTGVRPGLVSLGNGRAALQSAARVHVLDLETGTVAGRFEPAKLIGNEKLEEVFAPRGAPGWPLLPLWDGEALVLVQGTATPKRGNALISLGPPEKGSALPSLRWAVEGAATVDANGSRRVHALLEELGVYEFQPGPVAVGELIVAQVWERLRKEAGFVGGDPRFASGGEVRAWIVGFDRRTGEPRWRTLLAKGVERGRAGGRFLTPEDRISSGQPLAAAGSRVLVGTNLGLVASVAVARGRVDWTLRTRRRDAERRGWSGERPLLDGELVHYAPPDGDRLYWLVPGPDLEGRGICAHPPAAVERGRVLADVIDGRSVVLARPGTRPTIALLNPVDGERRDSLYLAPEESFAGRPAVAGDALLLTTDRGLYVFDRERELYLVAGAGLLPQTVVSGPRRPRTGEVGLGGTVHPIGDRVVVVGPQLPEREGRPECIVWVFGPRPE